MNFKLVSNYFKVVIACLLGGILLSHYLEPFQIKSFLKIRNMFYFSSATSKEMSDGIVYSKYKGLDSAYFNPVNFVQFVWPEIYTTLSEHVDEKYFLPNDKIVVDTTKLIKFSQKLMEFVDTIFIDDPIGHFDDLNILSFIDVLRTIITETNWQIIISTHDENFYEVMKIKLNSKYYNSKFFKFKDEGNIEEDMEG